MIKIVIKRDVKTQKITKIEVKGHANSDVYGKDLVCAAVTTVLTGGMNALQDKNYDFALKEGYILINSQNIPSDYDSVVLKTIETQLLTIEESNHQYVRIENL
ncbi:MAG: ribosomal-processing cysteine protease Prp [Bacilli bacterium]|nr:ribosomal-processing cysteine protease Prp [Bacilli bacterium]